MKEIKFSTVNELFKYISNTSNRKLYFRGENKNFGYDSCLPQSIRSNSFYKININHVGDIENNWFSNKLEYLGIKTPYWSSAINNDDNVINNVLLNNSYLNWQLWSCEKLDALMKHYSMDFEQLKDYINETDLELSGAKYLSNYLDITYDIIVALHFSCSEFCFYKNNDDKPHEMEIYGEGYLFVFDLSNISSAEYIIFINYPNYSYFFKNGDRFYYQPFDRITHQRGAFIAPKNDKNGIIDFEIVKKEIKEIFLIEKIIISIDLKKELFEIFGKENGLNYYFPKIPLILSEKNEIFKYYQSIKGITLLEKKIE